MVAVFPARIVRGFAEARSTLARRHQHAVVLVPITEYDALGRTSFRIEVMRSRPVRVTTNQLAHAVCSHGGSGGVLLTISDFAIEECLRFSPRACAAKAWCSVSSLATCACQRGSRKRAMLIGV